MKRQNLKFEESDEMQILSEQLGPLDMQIIGYLKGFDRKKLKEWERIGLMDFSVN